jgi:hypothetical protein
MRAAAWALWVVGLKGVVVMRARHFRETTWAMVPVTHTLGGIVALGNIPPGVYVPENENPENRWRIGRSMGAA